jgi:DNA repair protein RecN (Recombination protein N)
MPRIEVVLHGGGTTEAQVTCDGQVKFPLDCGDRVRVCRKDKTIRLLHPPGHDHYEVLREKLRWGPSLPRRRGYRTRFSRQADKQPASPRRRGSIADCHGNDPRIRGDDGQPGRMAVQYVKFTLDFILQPDRPGVKSTPMLTHIHIRDFVLVDELELELDGGMTALTGETGAGKSILVDALGLLLGDRAEASWVRHGSERAEISAGFHLDGLDEARAWLAEQELDNGEEECQLRRVISREGRSRAFINASPVPLQSLRELGDRLVDIHGQHEHQSLVRQEAQRALLDGFGGHGEALAAVAAAHGRWRALREELEGLRAITAERDSRLEFVRFQVGELEGLQPRAGELGELEEEHARLANAGQLLESCASSLQWLYDADEDSAHDRISQALREVEELAGLDASLRPVQDLLTEARIQVQEAADTLRRYTDRVEQDPQRLRDVEQRLGTLHDLARKHRVEPAALPELFERLGEGTRHPGAGRPAPGATGSRGARCAGNYQQAAQTLHKARAKAAREFGTRVSAAMQDLGMPGGVFGVEVTPREDGRFTAQGSDRIEFRVSANPGQPPMALGKVASGGELSRISLAIQVIATDSAAIPTLIFDEVDTGIGGGVAETVGRLLRALGEQRQVLCVTHLPQVAAQAHQHLQVSKLAGANSTRTSIRGLGKKERVDEIARMLGGIEITESTLRHAGEMLERVGGGVKKKKRSASRGTKGQA